MDSLGGVWIDLFNIWREAMTRRALLLLMMVFMMIIAISTGHENEALKAQIEAVRLQNRILSARYYGLRLECLKRHLGVYEDGWNIRMVKVER